MRILSAILAMVFLCFSPVSSQDRVGESRSAGCGSERILVKSMVDADASRVSMNPVATSVDHLISLPVPDNYDRESDSRYPAELHLYRLKAELIGWKLEKDRDFHIVIAQPGAESETMIVEPPDPQCPLMAKGPYAKPVGSVRAQFVHCFGQPGRFQHFDPGIIATLEGVGYFDPLHGQTGVAPNGIEMHPLLKIQFSCPTS